MLQVPNYTLKHPQNKSDPVLVAERSHGEEKSDRNSFWRKSASWSLLVAQRATPVHEKSALRVELKIDPKFHFWCSRSQKKLFSSVIHTYKQKMTVHFTDLQHIHQKGNDLSFLLKNHKTHCSWTNIYKFPFFPIKFVHISWYKYIKHVMNNSYNFL